VTIILKMISTIAVIVLSPFGHFSRLPYCASNVLLFDRTLEVTAPLTKGAAPIVVWG
jgi:hypothetical protein